MKDDILNSSTIVALDTCFKNLYLFEKNEKELDKTYKDLEKIENILKSINLNTSNHKINTKSQKLSKVEPENIESSDKILNSYINKYNKKENGKY